MSRRCEPRLRPNKKPFWTRIAVRKTSGATPVAPFHQTRACSRAFSLYRIAETLNPRIMELTMRYNQLGNTGLFVSELCLGTMTFGAAGGGMWGAIADVDQDAADRIVERSLAAGVNFIDTADVYSAGDSERLLGQSLINLGVARKDVVIATKVFGQMGEGPNDRGASRGHIMDSVEESLDRFADGPYRSLSDPWHRYGDADRRDVAGTGRSGFGRAGPLCRHVQLAGLAHCQGAGCFRAQGFCKVRDAAGLLLDRRPRSGSATSCRC